MWQLEILNTRYNIVAQHLYPLAMSCAQYSSVVAAVGILRIDWSRLPHIPTTFGYFILTAIFLAAMFIGYSYYRIGETLVSESNESLSALQLKVEAATVKELKGLDTSHSLTVKKLNRRIFRRRPLAIRLWFFMTVEDGMALDFLQSVLANILTGIVMINFDVPIRLL